MGEADILRRAMGKKDRDLMAKQRETFVAGCAERGVTRAKADRVWELMEKFAGYGFNKSHAAAYALVAYQTAYFKANYPVEFMAALLTSEMGDTDKIVKYIEECRAMGIRVEPPDVNVSAVRFSVAGDTVRFGLAAIRNVGEAAMESILRARAEAGPFTSLEDFCARVDLRLVNRRVLESLSKAGAFDSLGLTRAHLLATADAALESGQRKQRDRAEGQASFFDLLPAGAPAPSAPVAEAVPEWEPDQRLAFEKEVLGFYVSGHPLARFRGVVESLGLTTTAELAAKGRAERVPDPSGGRHGAGGRARRAPSGLRRASGTHPAVPPPPSRVAGGRGPLPRSGRRRESGALRQGRVAPGRRHDHGGVCRTRLISRSPCSSWRTGSRRSRPRTTRPAAARRSRSSRSGSTGSARRPTRA